MGGAILVTLRVSPPEFRYAEADLQDAGRNQRHPPDVRAFPIKKAWGTLLHKLDRYRGIYLSSGYEYPERYSRWDVASVCPPIEIIAAGRDIEFNPLNARGEVLNKMLYPSARTPSALGKVRL